MSNCWQPGGIRAGITSNVNMKHMYHFWLFCCHMCTYTVQLQSISYIAPVRNVNQFTIASQKSAHGQSTLQVCQRGGGVPYLTAHTLWKAPHHHEHLACSAGHISYVCHNLVTSQMVNHCGGSLSKQHYTLPFQGTQRGLSLFTIYKPNCVSC